MGGRGFDFVGVEYPLTHGTDSTRLVDTEHPEPTTPWDVGSLCRNRSDPVGREVVFVDIVERKDLDLIRVFRT